MGADITTFYGLSGLGDLVLTCTGALSRNYQVGIQLAKGANMTTVRSTTRTVAEGIPTSRAAMALAERHHVDMPIVRGVYQMLFEGRNPRHIVTDLMSRLAKGETDGLFATSTGTIGPRAHS